MQMLRATRRLAAWIAALAVLMAALAPAVSHALGSPADASWVEVCSAQGSRWLKGETESDGVSLPGLEQALNHCPYCSIHADVDGVPPAALQALPAPGLTHAAARAFPAAPQVLHAWVSAQPRAPPFAG